MYSVWRTSIQRQRDQRASRGCPRAMRLSVTSQAFHHLPPIYGDSTFINDTIRREHSPPMGRDE